MNKDIAKGKMKKGQKRCRGMQIFVRTVYNTRFDAGGPGFCVLLSRL